MPEIVRLSQAARRLGVCSATLRKMVARGDLPVVKLGRRWTGLDVADLERFISARKGGDVALAE